jgi:oxygen-dependent protoporphyrinogen oxidase
MIRKETNVLIVGAGLTGLTTAHYLNKKNANFLVVDRKAEIGGVIQTVHQNGFTFEKGPNTGVVGNDEVCNLFDDLKGLCSLQPANVNAKRRLVLKNGKWEALPSGLIDGISTPLFTFRDKIRLLGEPFRKAGTNPNETLDQLVLRRMGKSFLDYAVDPFVLGIYAGDPSLLVPRYALPKLYNLEQKYGSFIGGTVKQKRERKRTGYTTRATRDVFSVDGGLSSLTNALYQTIGDDHFLMGVSDMRITHENDKFIARGRNAAQQEVEIVAEKVVTTTGAHKLPKLLSFAHPEIIQSLTNVKYAKVVQVSVGFKQWEGIPLQAFGALIPHSERRDILGILFPSSLFPGRAPENGAMLSVFMGGIRKPEIFDLPEPIILQMVKEEIISLMGLKEFNPDLLHVFRYEHAIPQYGAETAIRLDAKNKAEALYPGLIIGGNLHGGIGMADRIKQGVEIAGRI